MRDGQFIIITKELLPELARELAPLIRDTLANVEEDPYLSPKQLSDKLPVMSEHLIRTQIRSEKYGKKYGTKGKLVARLSEVKKYNRI
jgi:hypothetical protein